MAQEQKIEKTTLLHDIYRSLLEKGRTYAAFEAERILPLVHQLRHFGTIVDPMSGYGTLMSLCASMDDPVSTINIECNLPSFYWQLLANPENTNSFLVLISQTRNRVSELKEANVRAVAASGWYPDTSLEILTELWELSSSVACTVNTTRYANQDIALAFLLPFVARFSTYVHSNVVTHVKKGGICVYKGWKEDFGLYLNVIELQLRARLSRYNKSQHFNIFGDARTVRVGQPFSAMITSPPYPNGTDYSRMFAPENAWIEWLINQKMVDELLINAPRLIGSPIVSEKTGVKKRTIGEVQSPSARRFLEAIASLSGTKRAKYDNEVYYLPYFCNYFCDLENAYRNIADQVAPEFEGYVIVVNNTARKIIVPVAEAIVEMWKMLGFDAEIDHRYTRELAHVGGINPGVKGLAARHHEYTIRIVRNA